VWAFRLVLCDRDGRLVLDTLFGVALDQRPGLPSVFPRRSATTRALLDIPTEVRAAAVDVAGRMRSDVRLALERPLQRWIDRETMLVERIRQDHARLAAPLLQGGLFDRRAERESAYQQVLLDQALSGSSLRFEELAAHTEIRLVAQDLAWALLLE
jgi:hypothetical protein